MTKLTFYTKNNFPILSSYFNIIDNFKIDYNGNKAVIPFDFVYFDEHVHQMELFNALKIPVLGFPRISKIQQIFYLDKYEINHPETYDSFSEYLSSKNRIDILDSYLLLDWEEKIVLKPYDGARGIGQLLTTRKEFDKIYYEELCKELTNKINYEVEPYSEKNQYTIQSQMEMDNYANTTEGMSDTSYKNGSEFFKSSFRNGEYLVQKFIDVKKEYRLIYFYNKEFILYEKIKSGDTWMFNLCAHKDNKCNILDVQNLETVFSKDFLKKFYKFFNELNTPVLSVDVYEDSEGNLGIFEFQQEFAYETLNPKLVRDNWCQSLELLYYDNLKNYDRRKY